MARDEVAPLLLPHAEHALVPGSGHLVVQDDPDLTASIVGGHAKRLPPADSNSPASCDPACGPL
ncbi:hypothetical protein [Saccharothrix deserti]|uniref:hypothetical protein n=1 Tax=Saccharothrix deserti TaxID=2593674 RepID=UPI00131B3729|nr:hypothetical protein [Saccharothrix deserti]